MVMFVKKLKVWKSVFYSSVTPLFMRNTVCSVSVLQHSVHIQIPRSPSPLRLSHSEKCVDSNCSSHTNQPIWPLLVQVHRRVPLNSCSSVVHLGFVLQDCGHRWTMTRPNRGSVCQMKRAAYKHCASAQSSILTISRGSEGPSQLCLLGKMPLSDMRRILNDNNYKKNSMSMNIYRDKHARQNHFSRNIRLSKGIKMNRE